MGERFILPDGFPSVELLEQTALEAIKSSGDELITVPEIKKFVIKKLKLSDEVLEFENTDGTSTLIDYRLRWVRTSLKNKGLIENVKKGSWKLVK